MAVSGLSKALIASDFAKNSSCVFAHAGREQQSVAEVVFCLTQVPLTLLDQVLCTWWEAMLPLLVHGSWGHALAASCLMAR